MVERGDEKTHRCGAGGGDARGDGGAQHGGGGQGGEGGVDGGGGEADCVDGRVDGHVDGVASTGASTGASMRSVGASAGMCRAALPSPRLPAQLPRAPPRASPLPPAEEHAWVSRCCVVPPLLRCWAAGVAGAARLAVMPRAALQALGGAGGRRYSASCGAARFSVRALPTARWRRGGVRGVRSQGDCRCKVHAAGGTGGGSEDVSLGGARVGERFGLVRYICAFVEYQNT